MGDYKFGVRTADAAGGAWNRSRRTGPLPTPSPGTRPPPEHLIAPLLKVLRLDAWIIPSGEEQLSIAHVEVFIYTARRRRAGGRARLILVNRRRRAANETLTDLQHALHAAGLQQLEAAAKSNIPVVVGRRPRQRRVHADVAFIPREWPVDHATLHRLRNALVTLLDTLERDIRGDYFSGDVE